MHTLTPVSLVVSVNKIIEGTNMHYSWQLPPFQDDNVTFSLSPLTSNTFPPFNTVVLELYDQEPGKECTSIATNSHTEESLLPFSNCYTCRSAMLTTRGELTLAVLCVLHCLAAQVFWWLPKLNVTLLMVNAF